MDVTDPLYDRDVRENGKNPEDGFHPLEQGAGRQQDHPLRPFHQAHGALDSSRFGPGPCVRDQDGSDAHERGESDEREVPLSHVENDKSHEEKEV